ncbi:MAG: carbamoyltransferase HypF [Thiohalocapsa sp.]
MAVGTLGDPMGARVAVEIRVRGRVQGVGFRPTVWRLARQLGLDGEVLNDAAGVVIRASGDAAAIDTLLDRLKAEPPPLAQIEAVERWPLAAPLPSGFHIADSLAGVVRTEVAPDAAICATCAGEILTPGERRHRYAFTNCTHCGPRLSIVGAVPYDRANTTMAGFALCPACAAEYRNPADRRFHAEAIACPACGPRLSLVRLPDLLPVDGDAVRVAARLLRDGEILAVKGIGGYQLACDAANVAAVARLRHLKRRDRKPFALMARDLATIARYCHVDGAAAAALRSAAAPIVLLPAAGPERLPPAIAPGLDTLGFMLPTTPLHLLLLQELDGPAVMTSGNLADEPQVTGDDELMPRLGEIARYTLIHDRPIANRVDDSVGRVVGGRLRLLRRARGYAPAGLPLPQEFAAAPPLLAMGGEVKATFCLVKDGKAILSQHQGDLEHPLAFDDYRKNLALYRALFDHTPTALAADQHPEYLSAKLAREMALEAGLPLFEVQHHHAHLAACLAENGWPLGAPAVIGIVMDGLGWGDDGTIWGGEFLLGDYRAYRRLAALAPVAMPGGAQAVHEPWRNLYAHLSRAIGWPAVTRRWASLPLCAYLAAKPLPTLDAVIARGVNSPIASSCGRLFDAVAAALDISRERQTYEGEAAMRLEAIVDRNALAGCEGYPFEPAAGSLDPGPMWPALLDDLACGTPAGVVAARFHRGLAAALADMAARLAGPLGVNTVALSGGCFQNAVLLEETERRLHGAGLRVLTHAAVPANDGGLALGQAAVAAARLLEGER